MCVVEYGCACVGHGCACVWDVGVHMCVPGTCARPWVPGSILLGGLVQIRVTGRAQEDEMQSEFTL